MYLFASFTNCYNAVHSSLFTRSLFTSCFIFSSFFPFSLVFISSFSLASHTYFSFSIITSTCRLLLPLSSLSLPFRIFTFSSLHFSTFYFVFLPRQSSVVLSPGGICFSCVLSRSGIFFVLFSLALFPGPLHSLFFPKPFAAPSTFRWTLSAGAAEVAAFILFSMNPFFT